MIPNELFTKYYVPEVRTKKMGANKGTKVYVDGFKFDETKSRRDYLRELAEADRAACGVFLCRVEFNELTEDKWWDTPGYRNTHLKEYRSRITSIRKEYGLRSADVAEFMRVA